MNVKFKFIKKLDLWNFLIQWLDDVVVEYFGGLKTETPTQLPWS